MKEQTNGLIASLPVPITDLTELVLINALATLVTWSDRFHPCPSAELGGAFGASITLALRPGEDHTCLIAFTEAAGLVGVHAAESNLGLRVISVIAAEEVPAAEVHQGAQQVARALAGDAEAAPTVDLFDLPVGDGPAWTIAERRSEGWGPSRAQHIDAVLAAWSAVGHHDLAQAPGLADALATLAEAAEPARPPRVVQAGQTTRAEYTRAGFQAAAVTEGAIAMGGQVSRRPTHPMIVRRATVRFNRPYAVLATPAQRGREVDTLEGIVNSHHWLGVPVFSAWVAEVDDTPGH